MSQQGAPKRRRRAEADGASAPPAGTGRDGEASGYLTTTFMRICEGCTVQMTVKVPFLLNLCE
jgi:hypothetical protein